MRYLVWLLAVWLRQRHALHHRRRLILARCLLALRWRWIMSPRSILAFLAGFLPVDKKTVLHDLKAHCAAHLQ